MARATPASIVLFISSACNMTCRHCFIGQSRRAGAQLGLSDLSRLLDSLTAPARLMITGGEPFLRHDLDALLDRVMTAARVRSVAVNSNGYHCDRIVDLCSRLLAAHDKPLELTISLDGLAGTHDRIRRTRGSFQRAIECCEAASRLAAAHASFALRVNITATAENASEIPALVDELERRGYESTFTPVRGNAFSTYGVPRDLIDDAYNPEEAHPLGPGELEALVRAVRRRHPMHFDYQKHQLLSLMIRTLRTRTRQIPCYAGREDAVIHSNGDISICEQIVPFGNLSGWDWDLSRAWTSAEAERHRSLSTGCACIHGCNLMTAIRLHHPARGIRWLLYSSLRVGRSLVAPLVRQWPRASTGPRGLPGRSD